jgi:hypothetical protein
LKVKINSKHIKGVFFFALLVSGISKLTAQNATKYSNEFMFLGVGGKAMGMSNAQVSVTNDVYSAYWNPAGLVDIEENVQAAFMHSAYMAGIANYDYLGVATKPNENSALGFSIIRFGVDGILNTFDLIRNGEINYDRVTTFSAVDYAFVLSYAQDIDMTMLSRNRALRDARFSWGGNAKVIHRKAGPFANAWGFGFDVGFRATNIGDGWSFGAVGRDITSTFNSWRYSFTEQQKDVLAQTGNEIPINTLEITLPRLVVGGGKAFEWDKILLNTVLDFEMTTDGKRNTLMRTNFVSIDPRIGLEGGYKFNDPENGVFLRMGAGMFQRELNNHGKSRLTFMPTVGVGIKIKNFMLDYALSDIGDQSAALYSNVISIRIGINRSDKK